MVLFIRYWSYDLPKNRKNIVQKKQVTHNNPGYKVWMVKWAFTAQKTKRLCPALLLQVAIEKWP
jgi:hypothetical protein